MTILEENNLAKDERDALQDSFHSLKTLTRKHDQIAQHFGRALWCTLQAEAVFVLTLLTFVVPNRTVSVLCGLSAASLLLVRAAPVVVLALGLLFHKLHQRAWRRPMIYWSWWPCWTFLFCVVAAGIAAFLGRFLWESTLRQYYEIGTYQSYQNVDINVVPGSQLMDAGLVTFEEGFGLDRAKGGCFVNLGHTYCVAPIAHDGKLGIGVGDGPTTGSYDYFAVGIDCCSCPNQDFRCGEWFNPTAHGGIRSLDYRARPFYKLAVDDFSASWQKESQHPLFFEWVDVPYYRWRNSWHWAFHCILLLCCTPIPVVFLLAALSGYWLQLLVAEAVASPIDTPKPPVSLEKAWATFLPEMVHQYQQERVQILKMPICPTPWYAATPASTAAKLPASIA